VRNRTVAGILASLAGATLLLPAAVGQSASAAGLVVTAAPIQFWDLIDGLPQLPEEPEVPPTGELAECGDPADYDEIVYGSPGSDVLDATADGPGQGNGRQILVGRGGDDILIGGNHDDCLLGGPGDDVLDGGNGRDILIGGLGADHLDGGTGKDRLDAGGNPGDTCFSHGAPDQLIGCGGDESLAADDATTPEPAVDEEGTSADVVEPAPGIREKGDKHGNGHEPGTNGPAPSQGAGGGKPAPSPEPAPEASPPDAGDGDETGAREPVPGE
jgi:hypothetical protein